jgi:hypothetical protein
MVWLHFCTEQIGYAAFVGSVMRYMGYECIPLFRKVAWSGCCMINSGEMLSRESVLRAPVEGALGCRLSHRLRIYSDFTFEGVASCRCCIIKDLYKDEKSMMISLREDGSRVYL